MRVATLPRARSLGLGLPELVGGGGRVVFEKRRIESCHPCYRNAKVEGKKGWKPDLCSSGSAWIARLPSTTALGFTVHTPCVLANLAELKGEVPKKHRWSIKRSVRGPDGTRGGADLPLYR